MGKYWIHIVSWNGEDESSSDFNLNNNNGRYVNSGNNCYFYYRMNSNSFVDSCGATDAGGSLNANGGATYDADGGYINGGADMQGSNDYFKGSDTGLDITADWSFEAWVNTDDTDDGAIFFVGDKDGSTSNTQELSIGFASGDELELCYSDTAFVECDIGDRAITGSGSDPEADFNSNQWYHIAVVHDRNDADNNGDITIFVNGRAIEINSPLDIGSGASGSNDIYFGESDFSDHGDFDGQMDEVRMVNYEKRAFAAGLMISKIVPSTNSITIYNNNPSTTAGANNDMSLTGIEIYKDGGNTPECSFTGGIEYQATKTITGCTLDEDDGIYMSDANPSNTGSSDGDETFVWVIDAVCWNNDGSEVDTECEGGEEMILAGVWTADVAKNTAEGGGEMLELKANGNNDEGPTDWYVPEFGTLIMPIASVLLIVGYNYRRKETDN